jgi:hypothetical protein
MRPNEGLFDIFNPDYVLECNKVVDIGDVKVVASMNLHDDEGHKTPNEFRAMVGMKVSKYLNMYLKGCLANVVTNNQIHEVGNLLDTQKAIVETPTKIVVGDQTIIDTQGVKIGDQKPHYMSDTLVVIETT